MCHTTSRGFGFRVNEFTGYWGSGFVGLLAFIGLNNPLNFKPSSP